jgi:tetratricopeptide (TPR) repeat protein
MACAGVQQQQPVSPAEIPELEQRLSNNPGNAQLALRYASALYAAGRCDSARVVARVGWAQRPADATGPLIVGQCSERDGDYDQALEAYREFLERHPDADGAPTIRARELMAARGRATARAREALERESELAARGPTPEAVAVLPLEITGDSTYQPLSRGLAQMLISDLSLLQRFPIVERLQLGALLDEMALAQTGRVDSSTAARVGYLIQAGRLVQGMAAIPPAGDVRLEAGIVQASGEVLPPAVTSGRLPDLLRLEKALVLILTRRMGYQLSEAERRLILENGTQNLVAFLAYSRGLLEEDRGNYAAAAEHYAEAARQDPSFREAKDRHQASVAAPFAQQISAAQLPALASFTVADPAPTGPVSAVITPTSTVGAVTTALGDLASTHSEQIAPFGVQQTTQQATNTPISQPPPSIVIPPETRGTIRIIIRIP